jgi:23S rRNA pseudouridine2604 synthase
MDNEKIRLNKYIAHSGICSRREADRLIQEGKVVVNGETETNPARHINPGTDKISYAFDTKNLETSRIYIKLNKPAGYVVSGNPDEGIPVSELVKDIPADILPIGRIDKESCGLLLFTNDSSLPKKIIGENSLCEKEYYVRTEHPVPDWALERFRKGMAILGEKTKPAKTRRLSPDAFLIILTEGKNRQIRRMCRKTGTKIEVLKRVRIGEIRLGKLKEGKWEKLSSEETDYLKRL